MIPELEIVPKLEDLVEFKGLSLRVKRKLTWDEAVYAGNCLWLGYTQIQFAIGDFMNQMIDQFGEEAYQIPLFGYTKKALMNMRYVADRVSPEVRRNAKELGHSAHAAVALLESGEQKRVLDEAVEKGWTVAEIRLKAKEVAYGSQEAGESQKANRKNICPECGFAF